MGNRLEQKCKSITEKSRDPGNARYRDMLRSGQCSVSWLRGNQSWTRLVSNVTEVLHNVTQVMLWAVTLVRSFRTTWQLHWRRLMMWCPGGVWVYTISNCHLWFNFTFDSNIRFSIQLCLGLQRTILLFKDQLWPMEHAFSSSGITATTRYNCLLLETFGALQVLKSAYQSGSSICCHSGRARCTSCPFTDCRWLNALSVQYFLWFFGNKNVWFSGSNWYELEPDLTRLNLMVRSKVWHTSPNLTSVQSEVPSLWPKNRMEPRLWHHYESWVSSTVFKIEHLLGNVDVSGHHNQSVKVQHATMELTCWACLFPSLPVLLSPPPPSLREKI